MLTTILSLLLLADSSSPVDLIGKVADVGGTPIVQATVIVSSTAPKKGTANATAPEAGKSVNADVQGAFTLPAVDPTFTYDLLVLADGYRAVMLKKVDPARGQVN